MNIGLHCDDTTIFIKQMSSADYERQQQYGISLTPPKNEQ